MIVNEHPTDTHTEHCCVDHGCKYGDETCPVRTGVKPQSFPCEACEMEEDEFDPSACVYDGVTYPEHDYPPIGEGNECRRCGAEADED